MQTSGFTIHYLTTVDSTNNYAARPEIQPKLQHKAVIMTDHQTEGKGQYGNKWESVKGKNLLISIYLKPNLAVKDQFLLNCVAALAIKDTVSYFLSVSSSIKWPNDIFVNHAKIAGILIENSIFGSNINRSIIGIGININQTEFDTGSYNSFKLISNKKNDINRVLEYLLFRFSTYYDQIDEPNSNLHKEFDSHLYGKDELRIFKSSEDTGFQAKITGTTVDGKLILSLENGEVRTFNHKEVFFS
jgi:BirA family biotin operon repressor/biotin-[acetyl-CoA-carboxylase] ligase